METSHTSIRGLETRAAAWLPAPLAQAYTPDDPGRTGVGEVVADARAALEALQHPDGHWVFELEADATIPAEYVLLEHFLGEIDQRLEDKIAVYLRAGQADHGGWPLYAGGDFDLSATVKAYYALKLIGTILTRRTWRARALPSWRTGERRAATSSRASRSRCSVRCPGARCR